jgi:hypothetical protein
MTQRRTPCKSGSERPPSSAVQLRKKVGSNELPFLLVAQLEIDFQTQLYFARWTG